MSHSRISFVSRAVAALLVLGATVLVPRVSVAQDLGIKVGAVAPGAPVELLDGKPTDLATMLAGKVTLMEFWATWCPNCKQLEPAIKAVHAKYKDRVQFLAVAVSLNQSVDRVKAYQQRFGLPFTYVYDRRGDASEAYDAPATSYVVIVDATGKVAYTGVGGTQDLDGALSRVLGARR
ncbi:MAG: TlpA family protein disulfide reductase [Gemmatimonadaceae bacterium]|jgi:thiol-disulfide isomerase/thioredoxin|nr:TlpA family protein disulfide reductase [Gemmatimonadaceae bacterium]